MHKIVTAAAFALIASTAVATAQDGLNVINHGDNSNVIVLSGDAVSRIAEVLEQVYPRQDEPWSDRHQTSFDPRYAQDYDWYQPLYGNRCYTRFGWYWLPGYYEVNTSCPIVDNWGFIVTPTGGVVGQ